MAFGFLVVCAVYFMVSVDTSPLQVFDFNDINVVVDSSATTSFSLQKKVQFLVRGIKNPGSVYNVQVTGRTEIAGGFVDTTRISIYPPLPGGTNPNEYTYTFPVGSIQSWSNYTVFVEFASPVRYAVMYTNGS